MTNPNLTHLTMLLDRSGSMETIVADTIGGFNAFMAEQRKTAGSCMVTLAQFDNEYEQVYTDRPLADVPSLELHPRGSTALLDAIGRLVTTTGTRLAALPEHLRPGTVIIGIMTDGQENASTEWDHRRIKALIEHQTSKYGWQFLYMGADQDAIEVGTSIGVGAAHSITYGRGKVQEVMRESSANVSRYRTARAEGVSAPVAASEAAFSPEQRAAVEA